MAPSIQRYSRKLCAFFVVTGILEIVNGFLLGVIYFSIRNLTTSLEHAETIPSYATAILLVCLGVLSFFYIRISGDFIGITIILLSIGTMALASLAGIIVGFEKLPAVFGLHECMYLPQEVQCHCRIEGRNLLYNSTHIGSVSHVFYNAKSCDAIEGNFKHLLIGLCTLYACCILVTFPNSVVTGCILSGRVSRKRHHHTHRRITDRERGQENTGSRESSRRNEMRRAAGRGRTLVQNAENTRGNAQENNQGDTELHSTQDTILDDGGTAMNSGNPAPSSRRPIRRGCHTTGRIRRPQTLDAGQLAALWQDYVQNFRNIVAEHLQTQQDPPVVSTNDSPNRFSSRRTADSTLTPRPLQRNNNDHQNLPTQPLSRSSSFNQALAEHPISRRPDRGLPRRPLRRRNSDMSSYSNTASTRRMEQDQSSRGQQDINVDRLMADMLQLYMTRGTLNPPMLATHFMTGITQVMPHGLDNGGNYGLLPPPYNAISAPSYTDLPPYPDNTSLPSYESNANSPNISHRQDTQAEPQQPATTRQQNTTGHSRNSSDNNKYGNLSPVAEVTDIDQLDVADNDNRMEETRI